MCEGVDAQARVRQEHRFRVGAPGRAGLRSPPGVGQGQVQDPCLPVGIDDPGGGEDGEQLLGRGSVHLV